MSDIFGQGGSKLVKAPVETDDNDDDDDQGPLHPMLQVTSHREAIEAAFVNSSKKRNEPGESHDDHTQTHKRAKQKITFTLSHELKAAVHKYLPDEYEAFYETELPTERESTAELRKLQPIIRDAIKYPPYFAALNFIEIKCIEYLNLNKGQTNSHTLNNQQLGLISENDVKNYFMFHDLRLQYLINALSPFWITLLRCNHHNPEAFTLYWTIRLVLQQLDSHHLSKKNQKHCWPLYTKISVAQCKTLWLNTSSPCNFTDENIAFKALLRYHLKNSTEANLAHIHSKEDIHMISQFWEDDIKESINLFQLIIIDIILQKNCLIPTRQPTLDIDFWNSLWRYYESVYPGLSAKSSSISEALKPLWPSFYNIVRLNDIGQTLVLTFFRIFADIINDTNDSEFQSQFIIGPGIDVLNKIAVMNSEDLCHIRYIFREKLLHKPEKIGLFYYLGEVNNTLELNDAHWKTFMDTNKADFYPQTDEDHNVSEDEDNDTSNHVEQTFPEPLSFSEGDDDGEKDRNDERDTPASKLIPMDVIQEQLKAVSSQVFRTALRKLDNSNVDFIAKEIFGINYIQSRPVQLRLDSFDPLSKEYNQIRSITRHSTGFLFDTIHTYFNSLIAQAEPHDHLLFLFIYMTLLKDHEQRSSSASNPNPFVRSKRLLHTINEYIAYLTHDTNLYEMVSKKFLTPDEMKQHGFHKLLASEKGLHRTSSKTASVRRQPMQNDSALAGDSEQMNMPNSTHAIENDTSSSSSKYALCQLVNVICHSKDSEVQPVYPAWITEVKTDTYDVEWDDGTVGSNIDPTTIEPCSYASRIRGEKIRDVKRCLPQVDNPSNNERHSYQIGNQVYALYSTKKNQRNWFPATIKAISKEPNVSNWYLITWKNNDPTHRIKHSSELVIDKDNSVRKASEQSFEPGDIIDAFYIRQNLWHPAKIIQCSQRPNYYEIQWEDNDSTDKMKHANHIQLISSKKPKKTISVTDNDEQPRSQRKSGETSRIKPKHQQRVNHDNDHNDDGIPLNLSGKKLLQHKQGLKNDTHNDSNRAKSKSDDDDASDNDANDGKDHDNTIHDASQNDTSAVTNHPNTIHDNNDTLHQDYENDNGDTSDKANGNNGKADEDDDASDNDVGNNTKDNMSDANHGNNDNDLQRDTSHDASNQDDSLTRQVQIHRSQTEPDASDEGEPEAEHELQDLLSNIDDIRPAEHEIHNLLSNIDDIRPATNISISDSPSYLHTLTSSPANQTSYSNAITSGPSAHPRSYSNVFTQSSSRQISENTSDSIHSSIQATRPNIENIIGNIHQPVPATDLSGYTFSSIPRTDTHDVHSSTLHDVLDEPTDEDTIPAIDPTFQIRRGRGRPRKIRPESDSSSSTSSRSQHMVLNDIKPQSFDELKAYYQETLNANEHSRQQTQGHKDSHGNTAKSNFNRNTSLIASEPFRIIHAGSQYLESDQQVLDNEFHNMSFELKTFFSSVQNHALLKLYDCNMHMLKTIMSTSTNKVPLFQPNHLYALSRHLHSDFYALFDEIQDLYNTISQFHNVWPSLIRFALNNDDLLGAIIFSISRLVFLELLPSDQHMQHLNMQHCLIATNIQIYTSWTTASTVSQNKTISYIEAKHSHFDPTIGFSSLLGFCRPINFDLYWHWRLQISLFYESNDYQVILQLQDKIAHSIVNILPPSPQMNFTEANLNALETYIMSPSTEIETFKAQFNYKVKEAITYFLRRIQNFNQNDLGGQIIYPILFNLLASTNARDRQNSYLHTIPSSDEIKQHLYSSYQQGSIGFHEFWRGYDHHKNGVGLYRHFSQSPIHDMRGIIHQILSSRGLSTPNIHLMASLQLTIFKLFHLLCHSQPLHSLHINTEQCLQITEAIRAGTGWQQKLPVFQQLYTTIGPMFHMLTRPSCDINAFDAMIFFQVKRVLQLLIHYNHTQFVHTIDGIDSDLSYYIDNIFYNHLDPQYKNWCEQYIGNRVNHINTVGFNILIPHETFNSISILPLPYANLHIQQPNASHNTDVMGAAGGDNLYSDQGDGGYHDDEAADGLLDSLYYDDDGRSWTSQQSSHSAVHPGDNAHLDPFFSPRHEATHP